jgi:hypothetical protein
MFTKNPQAENIFHKSADGAGFSRLRAAQRQREEFATICKRTHPSCEIYIDQVREYAGVQVVFYRAAYTGPGTQFEHARIAVFSGKPGTWRKESDIIAAQA